MTTQLFKTPMTWKKLGRIATPRVDFWWNQTHMSLPTVQVLSGTQVRIYYGGRDHINRSRVGYIEIGLDNLQSPASYSTEPVLGIGELGTFDDNGVMPCSVVPHEDTLRLYYVGWNPRATTRFSFYSGLAISRNEGTTFERYSRAPILERTDAEPFVNASPFVLRDGNLWRMYYVSGEGWIHPDLPKYNIKYAESDDGLVWRRAGQVCIDFAAPGEHALARPVVAKTGDIYRMWFGYKGADFDLGHNYRVGYAESADGMNFVRRDDLANIDVSADGWDSEMVTYGYVFEAAGRFYMVYNGNQYGYGGMGLAVANV
jgi:hypothetical protein